MSCEEILEAIQVVDKFPLPWKEYHEGQHIQNGILSYPYSVPKLTPPDKAGFSTLLQIIRVFTETIER